MTPHGEDAGDLRYRHKKFKKMATSVGVAEDLSSSAAASDTGWESPSPSERGKSSPSPTASVNGTSGSGRYVCPYCKMACAKPSVLQKHIRAHTNERPYPCVPCGFAFKTKSNLYKHCRSRAHAMKALGGRDEAGKLIGGQQEGLSEMIPTPTMSHSDPEDDVDEDASPMCPTPETPPLSAPQFLNSTPGAAYSPPSTEKPLRPGIYKPKFHTAFYDSSAASLETSHEAERLTSRSSSPGSARKISVSPMCYSPGAPSPEFLHRHISKIISENQAIVETMDPLWPRRYLRQHSGREESRSPEPQIMAQPAWPKKFLRQISAGPCLSGSQENKISLESISSSTPPPPIPLTSQANSRLALALLRPKQDESSQPVMTLQGGATVTLETTNNKIPPQPLPSPSPQQPLNLSVNNHINSNHHQQNHHQLQPSPHNMDMHRKRCISDSYAVAPSGVRDLLVNWSQQPHKLTRFMADCPPGDKNFHPQNPEGSIIKDLLLKARGGMDVVDLLNAETNASLYTPGDELHSSSSSQAFVCTLCKISYRNAENLEIHQRYYCKGTDQSLQLKEDSRRIPKTAPHSPAPRNNSRRKSRDEASKMAAAVELVALATPPPFPSPGPLLGSTPLVGGYNSSKDESPPLKKRRVHSISEDRPPSTGSLRSLEELSRSPMQHHRPNSLQMFGGKVHINDGAETKTMIIDSNRGGQNPSSLMSMPNACGQDDNHHVDGKIGSGGRKSPTNIVVTIAKSNLNSGGTIVQKSGHSSTSSSACTSVSYSVSSITSTLVPDQQLLAAVSRPIVPKISTPSLAPSLHHHHLSPFLASQMSKMAAYNPLTLPTQPLSVISTPQRIPRSPDGVVTILHGGREIPYVPGMPGPQSLSDPRPLDLACSPSVPSRQIAEPASKRHLHAPTSLIPAKLSTPTPSSSHPEVSIKPPTSPPPTPTKAAVTAAAVPPVVVPPRIPSIKVEPDTTMSLSLCPTALPCSISTITTTTTSTASMFSPTSETSDSSGKKFLRPTSLPLKPGTYTLKKPSSLTSLSGTTLISPETPRPRKSYGQLYLNGHAYTYLGLKCSTRVFFCCLNRPQPMYVPQSTDPRLSMYSNWKVCAPSNEPATELVGTPGRAIALYDSRHRPSGYTVARSRQQLPLVVTHSSQWLKGLPAKAKQETESKAKDSTSCTEDSSTSGTKTTSAEGTTTSSGESAPKRVKIFAGGFESNEEYTYVRGRGRGRYVCEECGIRCKKPSMLKKHIRTHTDVRPFTCKHCSFSFKTKGNLTKHMKSKAHYKKCIELGIVPVPTVVDDSYIDEESLAKQQALRSARGDDAESESEDEDEDEDDEEEEEDDDMQLGEGENSTSRPEREAACSLLSLSDQHAGLIPVSARPSTYPYSYGPPSSTSIAHTPTIVGPVSAHSEREKVSRNTRLAGPPGGTPRSSSASTTSNRVLLGDSSRYYFPSRRDQSSPPSDRVLEGCEKNSNTSAHVSSDEDTMCLSRSVSVVSASSSLSSTPPPMDLSRSSAAQPVLCAPHTPVTPVPDSAALLAALCSTVERLPPKLPSAPSTSESPAETTMLQAYLTERALQDVRIKQHQVHRWKGYNANHGSTASTPTTPTTPLMPQSPLIWSGQSTMLTPTLTNVPCSMLLSSPIKKFSPEAIEKAFIEAAAKPEVTTSLSVVTPMPASVGPAPSAVPVTMVSDQVVHKPALTQAETTSRKLIAIGQQHVAAAAAAAAAAGGSPPHSSSPGKPKAEFLPPSSGPSSTYASVTEDGKSICVICNKVFSKPSQLRLHVNIHYFERPFRCESCAVSFRTKGHLQKHERSVSHQNKVSMNSTFGMPTTDNPRPFKCEDCKIAFRIHGHLAKHLRSKMHIMKLECLGKLPFGTYAEMERSGVNLNEIDTTDCDNSLESLQVLAQKMYEKDPSKLQQWDRRRTTSESSEDIDDIGEPYSAAVLAQSHLVAMAGNVSSGEEGVPCPPMSHGQSRLSQPMSGSDYDDASDGENEMVVGRELPRLNCPACDQSFPSLGALKVHMFVEHDAASASEHPGLGAEVRLPPSSPAGRSGGPRLSLSPTPSDDLCEDTGPGARRYRCDLCGLLLRNQEALKVHVASHAQPRPFVCEFCDAGFTSKTLLLGHLALHQASGSSHGPVTATANCSF